MSFLFYRQGKTMNASVSLHIITSVLKSANQQPELALQLLQKSLEGSGTARTPEAVVNPDAAPSRAVAAATGKGLHIDIKA